MTAISLPRFDLRMPAWLGLVLVAASLAGCSARAEPEAASDDTQPSATSVLQSASDDTGTTRAAVAAKSAPAVDPDAYVIKRVLQIDGPFRHGDYVWDDEGVPDGPVVITVDLKAQTLSVFKGGYEIGAAVILYGADEKPTPTGVYPITQKDADHYSSLYNAAPMPYMLRMTNDGVSIHGSEIDSGYATHGCIGVPVAFAKKLFGVTRLGDKIIVTDGEMMKAGDAIDAI